MKRALSCIRRDLRATLNQLYLFYNFGVCADDVEQEKAIKKLEEEVRALERELVFNRYGRTDVL